MAIILKNAPKTEEGRKLQLTKEQEEKYKLVCRVNEEKEELEIVDLWNPEEKYENEYVIVPLTSTFGGIELVATGTGVKNVSKSTNDPKPFLNCNTWIDVMKVVYIYYGIPTDVLKTCCLDPYKYYVNENSIIEQYSVSNHGNTCICGGHMVGINDIQLVPDNGNCFLLPICSSHNNFHNDSFFFIVAQNTYAVMLKGFRLPPSAYLYMNDLAIKVNPDEDIEFDMKSFCKEHNITFDNMFFDCI